MTRHDSTRQTVMRMVV